MILIKDTTTVIYFNKSFDFNTNYTNSSNISHIELIITPKLNDEGAIVEKDILIDLTKRYIKVTHDLTDLAEGTYTYKLLVTDINSGEQALFGSGILLRQFKDNPLDYTLDNIEQKDLIL